jgi:GDPmannose 4,6-dehydratase
VIATGMQYSVRDFIERCAERLKMKITWRGTGVNEEGVDADGRVIIAVDSRYFRPTEVETLLGDASKARKLLGWEPRTTFDQLVAEMIDADLISAERDVLVKRHGYVAYNLQES